MSFGEEDIIPGFSVEAPSPHVSFEGAASRQEQGGRGEHHIAFGGDPLSHEEGAPLRHDEGAPLRHDEGERHHVSFSGEQEEGGGRGGGVPLDDVARLQLHTASQVPSP